MGTESDDTSSTVQQKPKSSQKQLVNLVLNLQNEVELLKSCSPQRYEDITSPVVHKSKIAMQLAEEHDYGATGDAGWLGTDYAEDSDSCKFRTLRKRVQEKFRYIGTCYNDKSTPDEIKTWSLTTANESMVLTGQHSNVLSKLEDMGPFKKTHV